MAALDYTIPKILMEHRISQFSILYYISFHTGNQNINGLSQFYTSIHLHNTNYSWYIIIQFFYKYWITLLKLLIGYAVTQFYDYTIIQTTHGILCYSV